MSVLKLCECFIHVYVLLSVCVDINEHTGVEDFDNYLIDDYFLKIRNI